MALAFLEVAVHVADSDVKYLRSKAASKGSAAMIPGEVFRAKAARRHEYLSDAGFIPDAEGEGFTIPAALAAAGAVRHVATLSARKRQGEIVSDQDAAGAVDSRCPILAAPGIDATTIQAARVPNTQARRQASTPCPACLLPLWRRDAAGTADAAGEYDAASHRIRDARGVLRGA